MKRILIVKTTSMGDVIHALPVVEDVLKYFPNAKIDWLVEESFADIPRMHPHVQQVFTVAVRRWRKQWCRRTTWQEIRVIRHELGVCQYDVILDLQGLVKSAIMATWAHGPIHGYGKQTVREPLARCFYQHEHEIAFSQHAVKRMRHLAASALGYQVPGSQPEYGLSSSLHHALFPAFLALHASSVNTKLWPEQHWVGLGQFLTKQGLQMWLPWASTEEQARAQRIVAQVPGALVLPRLSLAALANKMREVQFAVGVDTGLSHLAAALDVPVLAIYTDTEPELTGVKKGSHAPAINVGGKGQLPSVAHVIAQVTAIVPTIHHSL